MDHSKIIDTFETYQVAMLHHEDEEQNTQYFDGDTLSSLVVTRVLTINMHEDEDQRCNLFQTRAGIMGKSIKVIIDGGSCHNLASEEMCDKLNLHRTKHPHPYHVQWLSDNGSVKIHQKVKVSFKIGPYEDTVECDVAPMTVCHLLLERPWQFDKGAMHDERTNQNSFKWHNKNFVLRPMTLSQVIANNAKTVARTQQAKASSEMSGERENHLHASESHKPNMSGKMNRVTDACKMHT